MPSFRHTIDIDAIPEQWESSFQPLDPTMEQQLSEMWERYIPMTSPTSNASSKWAVR